LPWQTRASQKRIYQPRQTGVKHLGELVQRLTAQSTTGLKVAELSAPLLVFMDDATSRLMSLRFAESENTFSYFAALEDYLDTA
jgi:hypothetical protein